MKVLILLLLSIYLFADNFSYINRETYFHDMSKYAKVYCLPYLEHTGITNFDYGFKTNIYINSSRDWYCKVNNVFWFFHFELDGWITVHSNGVNIYYMKAYQKTYKHKLSN